jgi:hypothetical protein
MKKKYFAICFLLIACLCGEVIGQRQLDGEEILNIYRTLTSKPRGSWISYGTIQATHLEYKASNKLIMESAVLVRYDGNRFYWEINTDSCHTEGQFRGKTDGAGIDMGWNKRRVFVWDGQNYTIYFGPGNHAIVTEDISNIPVAANGPLTAGLVPWGHGVFTFDSLSAASSAGIEFDQDGQKKVRLTIEADGVPQMILELYPAKDYAVSSISLNRIGKTSIVKTCGDYRLVSKRWIPHTVEIEKYDTSLGVPELLAFDHWSMKSVNTAITERAPFSIDYDLGTYVEHYISANERPLLYYYNAGTDTEWLRRQRLDVISAERTEIQNCATVTLQYVLKRLSKEAGQLRLRALVDAKGMTSMDKMKQLAAELNLQCRAVTTDIETLRNLKGCYAILHLPGKRHFVVLDRIDEDKVWLIDLDQNKFYFPVSIDTFRLDWQSGTTLLISTKEISLQEGMKEINENDLKKIIGADSFGTYSCTQLIQNANTRFCLDMIAGFCSGNYRMFYERYACQLATQGGECSGNRIIGSVWCDCVEDIAYPGECASSGDWFGQYIHACQ